MPECPQYSASEIENELENLSRRPFRRFLARLLANAPTDQAIADQAEKHPDRWGQTSAMFARMSGYTDKLEVEGSLNLKIQGLSDSELEAELTKVRDQLETQSSKHDAQLTDSVDVP